MSGPKTGLNGPMKSWVESVAGIVHSNAAGEITSHGGGRGIRSQVPSAATQANPAVNQQRNQS